MAKTNYAKQGDPVLERLHDLAHRAVARTRRVYLDKRPKSAQTNEVVPSASILDEYVMSAPSPQTAIDIFKNEWASKFPDSDVLAGSALLFNDDRVKWFAECLGGFQGKSVLELGPLEGAHTYMLDRLGAELVVAVEANTRAFLKCLIVKNMYNLDSSLFMCGDFVEYLTAEDRQFDACLASGVLYHSTSPVELISLIAKATDHVCLWTHYYDPEIDSFPTIREEVEFAGFSHTLHLRPYGDGLSKTGFCGGGHSYAYWMTRDDIINAFGHFGMTDIEIGSEEPHHPNGPAITLVASRPEKAGEDAG